MSFAFLLSLLVSQAPACECAFTEADKEVLEGRIEDLLKLNAELQKQPVKEDNQPVSAIEDGGFGGLKWGASVATFKKKYPKAFQSTSADDRLWLIEQDVAGKSALVGYLFVKNHLVVVKVVLREKYTNSNRYLIEHSSLQKLLTQKYGTPSQVEDFWTDDLYRDDPNKWGMAVATGRMWRGSLWKLPETEIELITQGESFETTTSVRYASRRYEKMLEDDEKKRKLSGL